MKNVPSNRLETIAHQVARIPFAKTILRPFFYNYKNRLKKKRHKIFKRCALTVIKSFDDAMRQGGFEYFLIFGSLLGSRREHGFIKHDCDIDVAMWSEDYSTEVEIFLEKFGFTKLHSYEIDNGNLAREVTFAKDNVSIDIFCVYPPIDDYPYIVSQWRPVGNCINAKESMKKYGYMTGRRLELPIKRGLVYTKFENLMLPVPKNSDEILRFYYGDNYMEPNPNWYEDSNFKYRKDWPDVKAIYTEF